MSRHHSFFRFTGVRLFQPGVGIHGLCPDKYMLTTGIATQQHIYVLQNKMSFEHYEHRRCFDVCEREITYCSSIYT